MEGGRINITIPPLFAVHTIGLPLTAICGRGSSPIQPNFYNTNLLKLPRNSYTKFHYDIFLFAQVIASRQPDHLYISI